jgi:signal transduction histidine kinase
LAAGKGIRIEAQAPEHLNVMGDRSRLHQILGNLIGNAIKFTPEGGEIHVEARKLDSLVEFAVRDSGPGIPAKDVPRLFDRFWQAQATARKGTGLGLSIVKAMVEAHDGTVSVDTAEGSGSTFFVLIPQAPKLEER